MASAGRLSPTLVGLQGVVVLRRELSVQSVIHWGGAILFIVGAMRHGKASNDLYDAAIARKEAWIESVTERVVNCATFTKPREATLTRRDISKSVETRKHMPPTSTAHATASDAQSVAAMAYKAFDAMSE